MNSTGPNFSIELHAEESSLSKSIKFGLLIFGECISIPAYVFVIYQFVTRRALYGALYNHVVIVNLFLNFLVLLIDILCHLIFLRLGKLVPSTKAMCLLWQYLDYGFWYGDLSLKFWASIERHLLIFHSALISTDRRRLLLHYAPLAFFSLYCPLVYAYLIFIFPTEDQSDYTLTFCGGPFFYLTIPGWFFWYESIGHYIMPIFLAILITAALPLRVFLQKSRLRVNTRWRQYRKMTVQLLSMIALYVFDLPYILVTIVRWLGYLDFGTSVQAPYFYYCVYVPIVLFPYAVIGSVPNLKQQFQDVFHRRWNARENTAGTPALRQPKSNTIFPRLHNNSSIQVRPI